MEAVEKTGYRINIAASNLRRQRTGTIVVMVPNLGNPFFSQILAGIESVAAAAGLGVLIVDTKQHQASHEQVFAHLHSARADGLIVLDGALALELNELGGRGEAMPAVVFACEWQEDSSFPSVAIDNHFGASLAIRHLHALGHQKIGHVSGPGDNVLTAARRSGAEDTLRALGLPVRPDWFLQGDFSLESGAEAAARWQELKDRPTAMFCSSDLMACGFISELNHRGFSVPRDVSVVGFDDIDIASRFIPALTTIRQPRDTLGTVAAEMLISRIGRPQAANDGEPARILPIELVVRESTCPPSPAQPEDQSSKQQIPREAR